MFVFTNLSRLFDLRISRYFHMSLIGFEESSVTRNLKSVLDKIEEAREEAKKGEWWRGQETNLVAISKTKPTSLILECYKSGHRLFGENYYQELNAKAKELEKDYPDIKWRFVGQIQSSKLTKLVLIDSLDCIETIYDEKHCILLEKQLSKTNRTLKVLIQVNTSDEKQKGGTTPDEAIKLGTFIMLNCKHLKMSGFMTIGTPSKKDLEKCISEFGILFRVREKFCKMYSLTETDFELSMGMSEDYELAIQHGSTSVRVGSAIFGPREYKKANIS